MNSVAVHVIWGNSKSEAWEDIRDFTVDSQESYDWTKFEDVQAYKSTIEAQWISVPIPTGEVIEVMAVFDADSEGFVMHVRQGQEAIAQVMCQSLSSMVFRTLGGETISIQVHPLDEG